MLGTHEYDYMDIIHAMPALSTLESMPTNAFAFFDSETPRAAAAAAAADNSLLFAPGGKETKPSDRLRNFHLSVNIVLLTLWYAGLGIGGAGEPIRRGLGLASVEGLEAVVDRLTI